MKTDLTTSIIAAIFGFVIAFILCNFIVPPIKDYALKTLGTSADSSLTEPDENVFNYRAINPTVEVYVGDCAEYDENGECIEEVTEVDSIVPDINNLPNNNSGQNNNSNSNFNNNNSDEDNDEDSDNNNESDSTE